MYGKEIVGVRPENGVGSFWGSDSSQFGGVPDHFHTIIGKVRIWANVDYLITSAWSTLLCL